MSVRIASYKKKNTGADFEILRKLYLFKKQHLSKNMCTESLLHVMSGTVVREGRTQMQFFQKLKKVYSNQQKEHEQKATNKQNKTMEKHDYE